MRPTGRPAYHTGFLSTLSLRRATASVFLIGSRSQFLSTLSLRRATRTGLTCGDGRNISIHALLAESDLLTLLMGAILITFLSTLSLRRATCIMTITTCTVSFLSTLSLRRATTLDCLRAMRELFLSTLSLRRATRNGLAMRWNTCISIHALLAESDIVTRYQL